MPSSIPFKRSFALQALLHAAHMLFNCFKTLPRHYECVNISQQLALQHSALGMPNSLDGLNALECMTDAEKLAVQALESSHQSLLPTDEAFRAIVGQAFPSIHSIQKQQQQQSDDALTSLGSDFEVVTAPDSDTSGKEGPK